MTLGLLDGSLNSKKMFCMTLFKSSPWRDVHRTDTLGPAWGLCMCVLVMGIVGNESFPGRTRVSCEGILRGHPRVLRWRSVDVGAPSEGC